MSAAPTPTPETDASTLREGEKAGHTINDGGSAFPEVLAIDPSGDVHSGSGGRTLRDWFAGQAVIGMMQGLRPWDGDHSRNAEEAYALADAMLAERAKAVQP